MRLETIENINIKLPVADGDQTIAPLILLPFVENCFKHCNKSDPEIEIKISMDQEKLSLICYNNKLETGQDRDGGVGLSNAKKRLELIYKNKYNLDITDTVTHYKVELNLDLNA